MFRTFLAGALATLPMWPIAAAPLPPIEAFARMPSLRDVSISPDGSRIAYIMGMDDHTVAATIAVQPGSTAKVVAASDPDRYELSWCDWANDTRLLCGYRVVVAGAYFAMPMTRLVAVNADGTKPLVLLQNTRARHSQLQDRIVDWTPQDPDTVLIELDDDKTTFPSVYELNVYDGRRTLHTSEHQPIRHYSTDGQGTLRLGYGYRTGQSEYEYFARLENEKQWHRLAKVEAFSHSTFLRPIAVVPGTNRAFAVGGYEGRSALWEIDLSDARDPTLVFAHPQVDAARPILAPGRRLLGIAYETDRPFIHYTDEPTRSLIQLINEKLPGRYNVISGMTRDEKKMVIHSESDVDAGTYYLYDSSAAKVLRLGTTYPELNPDTLGRMRSIVYPARDGVEIPGYLTVPPGVRAEKLPLIVMPHGGPVSRNSWEFSFLRTFLASRGYAVLQMNFRGSSGYGEAWLKAAHQDWGGLTYADITDGARWAIVQGIADPQRMCILGWSFGGYAALLGAVRNSDLYRCSVSIAGISDLHQTLKDARNFVNYGIVRQQIGTDWDKLREDSPLRHADKISIPVLLVHGNHDWQVEIDQSRKMAAALRRVGGKKHRTLFLENATHQLARKSDRMALLSEIEKFLLEHLGPGTP